MQRNWIGGLVGWVGLFIAIAGCAPDANETRPEVVYAGFTPGTDAMSLELTAASAEAAEVATTFTVSDPAKAEVRPAANGQKARLVGKAAGEVALRTARPGEATIVRFVEYSAAQLEVGRQRYETGRPGKAGTACKTCHTEQGIATGAHGSFLHHSSDAELVRAATTGVSGWDDRMNDGDHSWDLTAEERIGIPAYLRSLEAVRAVTVWTD